MSEQWLEPDSLDALRESAAAESRAGWEAIEIGF